MLATAFVVALASGAAGPLDVGWGVSPTKTEHTSAQDVGWAVTAGGSGDVGWVVVAGDSPGDVGWGTPAGADA
ncbi:hypothetical protein P2Q00_36220 [Streptomyces coacervatus]|uniref:hypothetical protein n=1 Tax=Streptomyces coacervatus TaxID=647381 RepID=UPI0023DBD6FA|nr:hypothetical protein [Streptomyces coacervatus]MDF2270837.1 hypothetical protein [Streptomyces coacervatus]